MTTVIKRQFINPVIMKAMTMELGNATILVTGANRGRGLAFARESLARGERKVYAGGRAPLKLTLAETEPVRLDVTGPDDVAAAASRCSDVTLLINNAGIATLGGFLSADGIESMRAQLKTNFFGPLRLSQAFAPVLGANGGGAILNVLSVENWINSPMLATYGASKSAARALTNGLRHRLRAQGTQVLGMHVGFVDYRPDARHRHAQVGPGSGQAAYVRRIGSGRRGGARRRAGTAGQAGIRGRSGHVSAGPARRCTALAHGARLRLA